ncbi:MAG: AmmeMemoRadiSam system protein B [Bacteroidota bacterium]
MRTRSAIVEGRFYPSSKNRIFGQIREIEQEDRFRYTGTEPKRIFGAVLPHAGHIYSGYQTVPFFQLLRKLEIYPDTFVIIHPNHNGIGSRLAIDDSDVWSNAIGDVSLDRDLAEIMKLPYDRLAHSREHSAEVIIPFLQYFMPAHSFSIVPVCMMDQDFESASLVAARIGMAVKQTKRNIMVIASCDFSHFLSPEEGASCDQLVLDRIQARDAAGIERIVKQKHISVCGYGPIMSLMEYAGSISPEYEIQILARGHSGEVIPSREVVNYISMIMYQ